jgi:hypothetical protein
MNDIPKNKKLGYCAPPVIYDWWMKQPSQSRSESITAILLSAIAPESDPLFEIKNRLEKLEDKQESLYDLTTRIKRLESKFEALESRSY